MKKKNGRVDDSSTLIDGINCLITKVFFVERISVILKLIACEKFSDRCLMTSVCASVLIPGWCFLILLSNSVLFGQCSFHRLNKLTSTQHYRRVEWLVCCGEKFEFKVLRKKIEFDFTR